MSGQNKAGGGCKYKPHVYESKRVSTCFFNTACGEKYVGMPLSGRCKNCERVAVKS